MARSRLRWQQLVVGTTLVGLGALGLSGCSRPTRETPDTSSTASTEDNMTIAESVATAIEGEIPGSTVSVNYRNDITVPATLALTVRVDDAAAALGAVAGQPIPTGTALDDAARPLAPLAAVAAGLAWQSQVDPLQVLTIDVVPGGDPATGDSWNLGLTNQDTVTAFDEAFGDRP